MCIRDRLYTRSKKRGNVDKILNVFCQHGASTSILVDAHPHIGTDKLPRVIENMRNTIIECGGEVHFETRMDSLIIEKNKITGIETNTGKTFKGPVILATGHSARDVYQWLYDNGVEMEAKGIAVGVRLEHPSMLIDQIQYHNKNGRGKYLPAAEYSFVTQAEGRGVYSFCMCPGGFVVPAASGPHQIVAVSYTHLLAAICEVLINLSVIPPKADTTTITGSSTASTICLTLKMLFTEPTDVPPNFITFMQLSIFVPASFVILPFSPFQVR